MVLSEYALYRGLFERDDALWEEASAHSEALASAYRLWREAEGGVVVVEGGSEFTFSATRKKRVEMPH